MESAFDNLIASTESEVVVPVVEKVEEPVVESQEVAKDPEVEKRENDFRSLREHKKQLEQDAKTARQEAEDYRKQLEYMRGKLEILQEVSPKAQEPKWENFNGDVDAYADAKAMWKSLQTMKTHEEAKSNEAVKQQQVTQRKAQVDQIWSEKLTIASAIDSDLKLAIDKLSSGQVVGVEHLNPDVIDAIKESPIGEELMKHIALHPTFASELAQLNKEGQARRLIALESMALARGGNLSNLRATVQQSQPAPVIPPKIGGQSQSARSSQTLGGAKDINEWIKVWKNK